MSQQTLKFSTARLKAIFFSLRLIQVLENSLSRRINVAGIHKYLVSFTVLKTLLNFNTQLDFVIPLHTNWIPLYFHSGIYQWCAADSFLQYTCQMTATMNYVYAERVAITLFFSSSV
jgi:hypothetical protein